MPTRVGVVRLVVHVTLQPAAVGGPLVTLDEAPSAARATARACAVIHAVVRGVGVDVPDIDCPVFLPGVDGAELEELLG